MDINRNVLFLNKCYSIKSLVIPMDRRWEPGVPDRASVHKRFNARPCVFRVLSVRLLCHCEWYAFSDRFVEPELNKVAEITAQVCTNSAEYIKRYRFVFAQFRHRSRRYADGFSEGHRADVHVDEQFPHFTSFMSAAPLSVLHKLRFSNFSLVPVRQKFFSIAELPVEFLFSCGLFRGLYLSAYSHYMSFYRLQNHLGNSIIFL